MLETLKQWDRELFIFLNSFGIERFDAFWIFITQPESWIPLYILFFGLFLYYYRLRKGIKIIFFLLLTVGVTLYFTDFVKEYIARLRPNNVKSLAELIRILQTPNNYSFFSGHASSSFSITTFVVLALRNYTKWIYLSYIWPLVFVLSRIYVGVHYPSDIFVGALVGTGFAFLFYFLSLKAIEYNNLSNNP